MSYDPRESFIKNLEIQDFKRQTEADNTVVYDEETESDFDETEQESE